MMTASGDLRGRSVEELLEVLERQEKLLNNKKFIAKLPDRGRKILDFTEKVRAAIVECRRRKEKTDLFSAFKLKFEQKQNTIEEKSHRTALPLVKEAFVVSAEPTQHRSSDGTPNSSAVGHPSSTIDPNSHLLAVTESSTAEYKLSVESKIPSAFDGHIKSNVDTIIPVSRNDFQVKENTSDVDTKSLVSPLDETSEIGDKCDVDFSSQPTTQGKSPMSANNHTGMARSTADDLVNSLKMISIKEGGEESSDASETSNQLKHTIANKSHFLDVIEKRARSPVDRKEKFRTNRLPPDSNSSSSNQSPGEGALRLSAAERRARDRKHLDDMTAATLPPLHHSPSQLIPLQESLALQMEHQKSYEEQAAKLAAQKLFEKLNIKIGPFNPEGDSYMKYQNQKEEKDSDTAE